MHRRSGARDNISGSRRKREKTLYVQGWLQSNKSRTGDTLHVTVWDWDQILRGKGALRLLDVGGEPTISADNLTIEVFV